MANAHAKPVRFGASEVGFETLESRLLLSASGPDDPAISAAAAILVDVEIVPVRTPSPANGSSLPTPINAAGIGSTYYVEVWVQDTTSGVGVTGGQVNLHYATAVADATRLFNADFDLLPGGRIDDARGIVENLGGGALAPRLGVRPAYARLAYVQMQAAAPGAVTYSLSPGLFSFALYSRGNIDFSQVDLTDTALVTHGAVAGIPHFEDFGDGTADGLSVALGSWQINEANRLRATPSAAGQNAIATLDFATDLPDALWMSAVMRGKDDNPDFQKNGFFIFDYQDPQNFKFAGPFFGGDKWRIGRVADGAWTFHADAAFDFELETNYALALRLEGTTATLLADGREQVSHTFAGPITDGALGLGTRNADTVFDDLLVAALADLPHAEDFGDDLAENLFAHAGTWHVDDALRYQVTAGNDLDPVSLLQLTRPLPDRLDYAAVVRPGSGLDSVNGLLIFDYQGPDDYKWAGAFVQSGQWRIGHVSGTDWITDAAMDATIAADQDHDVALSISGGMVTLQAGAGVTLQHDFGSALHDGYMGLGSRGSHAGFDNLALVVPGTLPLQEDFDDGRADHFDGAMGPWRVNVSNRYKAEPPVGADATSLLHLTEPLPDSYYAQATLRLRDMGTGYFKNAMLLFDYHGPRDYKYIGAYAGAGEWRIGHMQAGARFIDATVSRTVNPDHDYLAGITVVDGAVHLSVDGEALLSHTFDDALDDGLIGLGTVNAHAAFDDLLVLPGPTVPYHQGFDTGTAPFLAPVAGDWLVNSVQRYRGTAEPGGIAVSLLQLGAPLPQHVVFGAIARGVDGGEGTFKNMLLVFDYADPDNFKYAGGFTGSGQWRIGHVADGQWLVDAFTARTITLETDYAVSLELDGTQARLAVDGEAMVSHAFDAPAYDGRIGVGVRNGVAGFDDLALSAPTDLPLVEDFDDGRADHLRLAAGDWQVDADGAYRGAAPSDGVAVALAQLSDTLPQTLFLSAVMRTVDGGGGSWKNALLIFDYANPDNFKYAGAYAGTGLWQIGQVINGTWQVDQSYDGGVELDTDYAAQLVLDGGLATLWVDGQAVLAHPFAGVLNGGGVGMGVRNGTAVFDDLSVRGPAVLPHHEPFDDGGPGALRPAGGTWAITSDGWFRGAVAGNDSPISLLDLAEPLPADFQVDVVMTPEANPGWDNAFIVLDHQQPDRFKYVGAFVGAGAWRIGHVVGDTWTVDAEATASVAGDQPYAVQVTIHGGHLSLSVDGAPLLDHDYGAADPIADGAIGVGNRLGAARFDDLRVAGIAPQVTVAATLTADATPPLHGTVDQIDATVAVTLAGQTYQATNLGDGTWVLDDDVITPPLAEGTHDVGVSATGSGGIVGVDDTTDELVVDLTPPAVLGVLLSGTAWSADFRQALDPGTGRGYVIEIGSPTQAAPLPWDRIDQVGVIFSEHVELSESDLGLYGTNLPAYGMSAYAWYGDTDTALWTLDGALGTDSLRIELSSAIRDAAGNALAGEAGASAGDDAAFSFDLHVAIGDTDRNGVTSIRDLLRLRAALAGPYDTDADLNGDGVIDMQDIDRVRQWLGQRLP